MTLEVKVGSLKRLLISILIINLLCMQAFAIEFDTSVNDEIRKNYNPSKLEEDMALPALPKILENGCSVKNYSPTNSTKPKVNSVKPLQNYAATKQSYIRLKKGTKFKLKLLNNISDRSSRGTKVTFKSIYPITTTYYTIPSGTIFQGYILNSHSPQFTGNGGLIAITINSIMLANGVQPINAVVTKANSKMIFLNTIKGKRRYVGSMFKSMKPGCHYFKKMLSVSCELAHDGSSIFVAPFSLTLGVLAAGGNIFVSPILAVFKKGSSIHFNEGSEFEVKLQQDVFVYN